MIQYLVTILYGTCCTKIGQSNCTYRPETGSMNFKTLYQIACLRYLNPFHNSHVDKVL